VCETSPANGIIGGLLVTAPMPMKNYIDQFTVLQQEVDYHRPEGIAPMSSVQINLIFDLWRLIGIIVICQVKMDIVEEVAIVVVIKDIIIKEDIMVRVVMIEETTISQMIQTAIMMVMENAEIAIIQIIQGRNVIKRCGPTNSARIIITTATMAVETLFWATMATISVMAMAIAMAMETLAGKGKIQPPPSQNWEPD